MAAISTSHLPFVRASVSIFAWSQMAEAYIPSWDLSVVLEALLESPFEPLESASELLVTLYVALLLALTSFRRAGHLLALSE